MHRVWAKPGSTHTYIGTAGSSEHHRNKPSSHRRCCCSSPHPSPPSPITTVPGVGERCPAVVVFVSSLSSLFASTTRQPDNPCPTAINGVPCNRVAADFGLSHQDFALLLIVINLFLLFLIVFFLFSPPQCECACTRHNRPTDKKETWKEPLNKPDCLSLALSLCPIDRYRIYLSVKCQPAMPVEDAAAVRCHDFAQHPAFSF